MKKVILMLVLVVFVSMLGVSVGGIAFAETTEPTEETEEVDQSEWSAYFENTIMPIASPFVATIGSGILIFISAYLKRRMNEFSLNATTSQKALLDTVSPQVTVLTDKIDKYATLLEENKEDSIKTAEIYKNMYEEANKRADEQEIKLNALLEMVKLGFGKEVELVKTGTASQIARIENDAK